MFPEDSHAGCRAGLSIKTKLTVAVIDNSCRVRRIVIRSAAAAAGADGAGRDAEGDLRRRDGDRRACPGGEFRCGRTL